MKFRLVRLVAVTVNREIAISRWSYRLGEVHVQSIEHPRLTYDPGTLFLLAADVDLSSSLPMNGTEILVPEDLRRKLEKALEAMADLLSVTHQCGRSIVSCLPYIAIDPTDEESKEWIGSATAIRTGKGGVPDRMKHALELDAVAPLLEDRLDGASLLAEALCQNHPTGKLHEFMRLFERAFAQSARRVCSNLLADFLSPLAWGYDASEIKHWLHLRDIATHADRRVEYAVEADTRAVANRMEQAAFDVLFNKEKWRDPATVRRNVFKPIYGSLASQEWRMFKTPESSVDVEFAFFDGFFAYPLDLRLDLYRAVPKTWFTKTTDVEEPPPRAMNE